MVSDSACVHMTVSLETVLVMSWLVLGVNGKSWLTGVCDSPKERYKGKCSHDGCDCGCFLDNRTQECLPCTQCSDTAPCWVFCRHAEDSRKYHLHNNPPTPRNTETTPQTSTVTTDSKNDLDTTSKPNKVYLALIIAAFIVIVVVLTVLIYCIYKRKCSGKENRARQAKNNPQISEPSSPVSEHRSGLASNNVNTESDGEAETRLMAIDETEQPILREDSTHARQKTNPRVANTLQPLKQGEHLEGVVTEDSAPASSNTEAAETRASVNSEARSTHVTGPQSNGSIPCNALSVNSEYPVSRMCKEANSRNSQSNKLLDIPQHTEDNEGSGGGYLEEWRRSQGTLKSNLEIYEQLNRISWVKGCHSVGDVIKVYVSLGDLDPHLVQQHFADITGADSTKFHVEPYVEPKFEFDLESHQD